MDLILNDKQEIKIIEKIVKFCYKNETQCALLVHYRNKVSQLTGFFSVFYPYI